MQNVSDTYARLVRSDLKGYEMKLVIDDVGTFYEADLKSMSTSLVMFQGSPKVGKAIAAEINVSMHMPNTPIPRMACLRPYIRAKGIADKSSAVSIVNETLSSPYASYANEKITFAAESGVSVVDETMIFPVDSTEELTSEWIPQGVFYIDTREVSANNDGLNVLILHGYDAMLKAEQEYSSNAVVGDAPDTQYVQAIADAIGVEVDSRTWEIMSGYTIPFPLGYTMHEILGYIAASYVGCFIMTDEGKLRLVSLLGLPERERETLLGDENGDAILFGGIGILV